MYKPLYNTFKRDIKRLANRSRMEALHEQFGKNLAPSKLLRNIEKLHGKKFVWGDRGTNKLNYTRKEKLDILRSMTKTQKTFIATAVSKGTKDMAQFGFRGKKLVKGKTYYASGAVGSIKLKKKRKRPGVNIKAGLRFQMVPTLSPHLRSIKSEFKMDGGAIATKLKKNVLALYCKVYEKKLIWLRQQSFFNDLNYDEAKEYIKINVTDPLQQEFREAMGDDMDEDIERSLRFESYQIAKDTIFYYDPENTAAKASKTMKSYAKIKAKAEARAKKIYQLKEYYK